MLAWPPPTGLNTYLGFCWDYILLPGKTLPPLPQMPSTTNQFYENLRNWMSDFCPVPACHNTLSTTDLPEQIPTSLYSCLMVLIHKDGHVPPLAPLYEGPYKVLSRSLFASMSRSSFVSIQCLKPAFTADNKSPGLPPLCGRPQHLAQPAPSGSTSTLRATLKSCNCLLHHCSTV